MTRHPIKCEAIDVRTDTGICPGMSKTQKGEYCILGVRTPEPKGICGQAFTAIHPMAFAMMLTDKMDWEKNDYFDVVCPHGFATFRISRIKES